MVNIGDCVAVIVGAGADVKVVDDVTVVVSDTVGRDVLEPVEGIDDDLVLTAVVEEVGDAESVFEI